MALDASSELFLTSNGAVTSDDLVDVLRSIGLQEGDLVMAHTDLLSFGRIARGFLRDREALFDAVIDSILHVIGPSGTLLLPTFTTKSLETGTFELNKTPSETGILTEHFRSRKGVRRSEHPTHSMAVFGGKAELFAQPPAHPFGEGSSFDLLAKHQGKVLFVGADMHWCTFIHHIETKANVRYRKPEQLTIKVISSTETSNAQAYRFKRSARFWPSFERFRLRLVEKGVLAEGLLGKGYVALAPADAMLHEGLTMLNEEPHAFLNVRPWREHALGQIKRLARYVNDRLPKAIRPFQ